MTLMCKKHDWCDIYSIGTEMEETVVRWCQQCGAYRIDTDSDGRIMIRGESRLPLSINTKVKETNGNTTTTTRSTESLGET